LSHIHLQRVCHVPFIGEMSANIVFSFLKRHKLFQFADIFVHGLHDIGHGRLLQYRVPAALAMVGRLRIPPAIVVVKHEVLALKPHDIRNAVHVLRMFGYHESHRVERDHHTCRIDISALVIIRSGILCRPTAMSGE